MAQYAGAAYCPGNNNATITGTPITCPQGNCHLVEEAGAHGAVEFENTFEADNTGYIAIDDTNKLVVLAFRGSTSFANWKMDLTVGREDTDLCHKCRVHKGFWDAWKQIRDGIISDVLAVVATHQDYRFAIVGHSLGGALATLAAADVRKVSDMEKTELYTYGSPRVGNKETVEFLTDQSTLSYRVTSMSDPVVRTPPHWWGYYHTSPEYWVRDHAEAPGIDDIWVIRGYNNEHGSAGQDSLNPEQHLNYFGSITLCSPEHDRSGLEMLLEPWNAGQGFPRMSWGLRSCCW